MSALKKKGAANKQRRTTKNTTSANTKTSRQGNRSTNTLVAKRARPGKLAVSTANSTILAGWNQATRTFTLDTNTLTTLGLNNFIGQYWTGAAGLALSNASEPVVNSNNTVITVVGNINFVRPNSNSGSKSASFSATALFDTSSQTNVTLVLALAGQNDDWWSSLFPELADTNLASFTWSASTPSGVLLASASYAVQVNSNNVSLPMGMSIFGNVDVLSIFSELAELLARCGTAPFFCGLFSSGSATGEYAFTLVSPVNIAPPWADLSLTLQLNLVASVSANNTFAALTLNAQCQVGAGGTVQFLATYVPMMDSLTLQMQGVSSQGGAISLADLSSLLPATVASGLTTYIPPEVYAAIDKAAQLFSLSQAAITVSLADASIEQTYISLLIANGVGTQYSSPIVAMPNNSATLNSVGLDFSIINPLTPQWVASATLSANASLFETPFVVTASTDAGVNLQTAASATISFGTAIADLTGLDTVLVPALTCNNLQLGLQPNPLTLSLGGSLLPWSFAVGDWQFNVGTLVIDAQVVDSDTLTSRAARKMPANMTRKATASRAGRKNISSATLNSARSAALSVSGNLSGSVEVMFGSSEIGDASMSMVVNNGWQGSFTLQNLSLTTLFQALTGTKLPFVDEFTIDELNITLVGDKQLQFTLDVGPINIGGNFLTIDKAEAMFSWVAGANGASDTIALSLQLTGSAQGVWFSIENFSVTLSFDSASKTWATSDTINACLFGKTLSLAAGFSSNSSSENLNFTYSGNLLALSISDLSFAVTSLSLSLTRSIGNSTVHTGTGSSFALTLDNTFAISLATLDTVQGTLQLDIDKQTDSLQFTFTKGTTFSFSVCNIGGYNIGLSVGLEQLGLTYASDAWSLTETTGFAVTGFPQFLYHNNILIEPTDATPLPYQIQFVANDSGVTVTLAELVNIPSFDLSLNIGGVPISLPAWKGAAIGILNVQATLNATPGVSFELAITLPQSLNDIFLGAAAPFSQTPLSMTFGIGSVNGATGINFSVDSIPFLSNFVKSVQTPQGSGWSIDLGDFGALTIAEPSFGLNADTMSFQSSGWITGLETLQIPFKPLRSLLQQTPAAILADVIPNASLPLLGITNVKFVNGNYIDADGIVAYFSTPPWNSFIPSDVLSAFSCALSALKLPISDLPARMLNYLQPTFPNTVGWNIEIGSSASLTIDLQIGDQTVPRAQREALRIMLPALIGPPSILGFTIYGFSIGPVLGGALFELTLDCDIDQFDLLDIAAADLLHAADSSIPLPTASELVRTITIDSLYTIVIYEDGGIPIPLPLFFNDLGLDYYGAEGVGAHGHVSFPMPQVGLGTIVGVVGNLYDFCKNVIKDPTYKFPTNPDPFGTADPTFALNDWYLDIPAYLGGGIAGVKGNVVTIPVFDDFVKIFNAVRTIDFLGIIAELPASVTKGTVDYSLSSISASGDWSISATDSPKTLNIELSGQCAAGALADVAANFSLAASGANGFDVAIGFTGALSPFTLSANGSIVIDAKGTTPFAIAANTTLAANNYNIISGNGSAAYRNDLVYLTGAFTVLPPGLPFQISSANNLATFASNGYYLSMGAEITGLNIFPLSEVAIYANQSGNSLVISVDGTIGWSGVSDATVALYLGESNGNLVLSGTVNSSPLHAVLMLTVVQSPASAQLCFQGATGGPTDGIVSLSADFDATSTSGQGDFAAKVAGFTLFSGTATDNGNALAITGGFSLLSLGSVSGTGSMRQDYIGLSGTGTVTINVGVGDVDFALSVGISNSGAYISLSGDVGIDVAHLASASITCSGDGAISDGPTISFVMSGTGEVKTSFWPHAHAGVTVTFNIDIDSGGVHVHDFDVHVDWP